MSDLVASPPPRLEEQEGIDGFAEFVRLNPSAIEESIESLAERFKIDPIFVREVVGDLQAPERRVDPMAKMRRDFQAGWKHFWSKARSFFRRVTRSPWQTVLVTVILTVGVVIAFSAIPVEDNSTASLVLVLIIAGVSTLGFIFHMMTYFRHGQIRHPIIGSGVILATFALVLSYSQRGNGLNVQELAMVVIASLVFAFLYLMAGVVMSLVGGFVRVSRESKQEKKLDRQQLLERLFEIETRLQSIKESNQELKRRKGWIERCRFDKRFPLTGFAWGIVLGTLSLAILGTYTRFIPTDISNPASIEDVYFIILSFFLLVVSFIIYSAIGYLAGNVKRALMTVGLAFLGTTAVSLVPWGMYGPQLFSDSMNSVQGVLNAILPPLVLGVLAGFGAQIDESNFRKYRIRNNDPAQLLAEKIRIQWRLNLEAQTTCVMSVDVARSTKMKMNEDQLKVEFSFREYQKEVARITKEYSGEVFSTAGDGAIVAFPSCEEAVQAGRALQTAMSDFNDSKNRLDTPFRIRIGLHAGETETELSEAPFNNLIDIAAHIEKVAPVGGIAVSSMVAKQVPKIPLAEMANKVDGEPVSFVLDPILDA